MASWSLASDTACYSNYQIISFTSNYTLAYTAVVIDSKNNEEGICFNDACPGGREESDQDRALTN